ncbi:MAG: hypothetical protein ABI456_02430 [Ktedonobacteraceae bacterium]
MFDGISPNHRIFGSMFDQAKTSVARTAQEEEDARERMETCVASLPLKNGLLLRNEEGIWKLCRTFALKFFGSMFDAKAIHAQIPSNIEPNYHLNDVLGMLKVQGMDLDRALLDRWVEAFCLAGVFTQALTDAGYLPDTSERQAQSTAVVQL